MNRDSRPPVLPDNLPVLTEVVDFAMPPDADAEALDLPPELSLDEVLPADDTPGGSLFGSLPSLDLDLPPVETAGDAVVDGLFDDFSFEVPSTVAVDNVPVAADPVAVSAAPAGEASPWGQQERAASAWVARHPAARFAAGRPDSEAAIPMAATPDALASVVVLPAETAVPPDTAPGICLIDGQPDVAAGAAGPVAPDSVPYHDVVAIPATLVDAPAQVPLVDEAVAGTASAIPLVEVAAPAMPWPAQDEAVHDARVAVVDEAALLDAIYQRILPRMKVELSLWLQDAIKNQTRHLLSGVMQQMKEDYDMLFGETLRESIRQAIADIGRQQEKDR